jgi:hypothetical protein
VGQLGAAADLERHAQGGQTPSQLADSVMDLLGVDRPRIEPKVRCRDDDLRTVRHGATCELQAVEEVGWPVVDSGEEMEVKVG